ncbi:MULTISPECIES: type II toxin-antitoxin system Phd/YefM family antitoxin [Brevibacterium]|uniref:Antitoxin Phd_YefM, type II toxin-antitoxin system n=2 Tax=Brevibacterium antiquum TaxID=234835 RepID=A0A2H1IWL0_9MICO|nr:MULTISPECIES: type II toxin-antitoxin system Phd/YefM family antitoxin [Brevibacterium]SMX75569.1 Antitoxin Phd_YefM, type II toxin-antitoxin system [Brevibacterium antiquum]SMX79599.1 Antitoxin Phd_YefM, type II toxin-antitoxin system [Brevibacterium antiquum CNRZ 918]HCG56475.1 prevent-host-death family protein [Brevibacterium sp.]
METAQTEAVIVEHEGNRAAVIVSAAEYDRLLASAEEIDDIEAFDAARDEAGPNISWGQVRLDLAWM